MSTPSRRAVTSARRCGFAADFRLAGLVDRRESAQGRSRARRADEQRIAHRFERGPRRRGKPHAQRIRTIVDEDGRERGLAIDHRHADCAELLWRESDAAGRFGIDCKTNRRTAGRVVDAVLDVDDRRGAADLHLLERVGHLRRPGGEKFRIGREQLHHHRLRRAGEIANHVLQHLDEFDVQAGLGPDDLRAHIADHLVDAAAPLRLQLHGNVAGVRLGHGRETELQARAPRRVLDFWRRAQDGLDPAHHAVGLLQRAARRHHVVEHEAALVDGR
jgi:hypothetical protein